MDRAAPVVEARTLSRRYGPKGAEVEVLRGVDLTVRPGEFVAVLGPSGSGKSTLLNLLGLMDHPTTGEVFLAGRPMKALDEEERAAARNRHVGFVFQFDALMSEFTVLENVLMPGRIALAAGREPEAAGGRGLAGLTARARELMAVLDIVRHADKRPAQMSGGERQRAAIARALLNRPSVVLADEPTGNLDRPNAELVFSKLRELADLFGVAVVMVTHNESSVGYASRSARLKDGRIAEGAGER
ncbi:MAG: ABC transporter ATP-binding protein [Elusimicrobia bacterium]|nr:ABC transporter ATP-binding protein [Elusimicrobiota bacterium]